MADPMLVIIVGMSFLLLGVAMKKKKNPNGNAFFVVGLAMLIITIFLNILMRLF